MAVALLDRDAFSPAKSVDGVVIVVNKTADPDSKLSARQSRFAQIKKRARDCSPARLHNNPPDNLELIAQGKLHHATGLVFV